MVYQLQQQELKDEFEEKKIHREVLKSGEQTFDKWLPQTPRRAGAGLIIPLVIPKLAPIFRGSLEAATHQILDIKEYLYINRVS